jgi:spore maturation protein CgeB
MGSLKIVILGLSITSSWGNGHATTYRGLVRELSRRGHSVLFLERDVPWYAAARDLPCPRYGRTELYKTLDELEERFTSAVKQADLVIVGSFVPDGIAVGQWVIENARGIAAFYDIDTPVSLAALAEGTCAYLSPVQVRLYHLYLSFTGGPLLERLEKEYGAPMARPLYCSFDPQQYFFDTRPQRWDLGYMGTYSPDRQSPLEELLLKPARRLKRACMVVAGPQYPDDVDWPANVERIEHLAPAEHRAFYNEQAFTLNLTRARMIAAGYSPSVRLFEAAACAVPIISDHWSGLEDFFKPGEEILIAATVDDVLRYLKDIAAAERRAIGARARARVLAEHTAAHRAAELESYTLELLRA